MPLNSLVKGRALPKDVTRLPGKISQCRNFIANFHADDEGFLIVWSARGERRDMELIIRVISPSVYEVVNSGW